MTDHYQTHVREDGTVAVTCVRTNKVVAIDGATVGRCSCHMQEDYDSIEAIALAEEAIIAACQRGGPSIGPLDIALAEYRRALLARAAQSVGLDWHQRQFIHDNLRHDRRCASKEPGCPCTCDREEVARAIDRLTGRTS